MDTTISTIFVNKTKEITVSNSNLNRKFTLKILILVFVLSCVNGYSQSAFVKNNGQWDADILFRSNFGGGKLYIEKGFLNFNFLDTEELDEYIHNHHKKQFYNESKEIIVKGHCLKTAFINSNSTSIVSGKEKNKEYFNFYLGNDPNKWATKVSSYNSLVFNELYKGVDLNMRIENNGYKYDFIVKPNAEVSDIKLQYLGADDVFLKNENLYIETSVNNIIEQKPFAYQMDDGVKIEVACNFVLKNKILSFEFPNGYNENKELIIDPFIVFSRYSGSFADNFGYTATYDSEENAYGAGSVFSSGFITTPGTFDETFNGSNTDIGIVKYSSDGLQRLYSTYLGGSQTDLPHSIVVNSRDELFLLGTTSSSNMPIDGNLTCFDNTFNGGVSVNFGGLGVSYQNGSDMYIARFSVDGTSLLSSTFLGGTGNDGLNNSNFLRYNYADEIRGEILLDKDDNCFVVSCTNSLDFPVGPVGSSFQMTHGGGLDAVVVKMDENLTNVLWSTFLGGSSDDAAYSVDFDSDENIIIAGGTHSSDFPLLNPFQATFGGASSDGFISKIHSSGSGLLNSTYYGSAFYDQIYFVEINEVDEVHIFGQTKASQDELIFNAAYNAPNGGQMLAKFNKTVDTLIWATRFGDGLGVPDISPTAFLVDVCNRIFLSGWGWGGVSYISGTSGLDVTSDAIDNTTDNQDFYFMVLQDDASALVYASFFGGPISREHVDGGTSRFDKKGVIYQAVCAGCGGNQDFPKVPSNINSTNNSSNCNLGVVKYAFSPPSIIADFSIPPTGCAPLSLIFENQSQTAFNDTSQTEFIWTVNGQEFNTYDLDFNFLISGVYDIKLVAIDTQSCNFIDSITKQLTILGNGFSFLDDVPICIGNLGQIGVLPLTGNNISYNWTPNYFITATNIANPYVNPPVDTTYQLIVSNGNCTDTFIQKVVVGELAVAFYPFDSVCLETNITISATQINGALYQWLPEDLIISGQGTYSAEIYVENSNQDIGLTVTNLEGCKAFIGTNILTIDDLPDLELSVDPDSIEAGSNAQLLAEYLEGNSIEWTTNPNFNTLNIYNPVAEKILETTTYFARVDNGVCPKRDSVTVYVIIPNCLQGKLYVPNAFSPNGDGNNDKFKVRTTLVNIENFYFAVFDRWGNKLFETTDKTKAWDGTFQGAEMTPNVYGWYTEGVCPNGEDFFIKGNVTLLK